MVEPGFRHKFFSLCTFHHENLCIMMPEVIFRQNLIKSNLPVFLWGNCACWFFLFRPSDFSLGLATNKYLYFLSKVVGSFYNYLKNTVYISVYLVFGRLSFQVIYNKNPLCLLTLRQVIKKNQLKK